MSLLLANVRYACRVLRRQPAFSSVAILTMALGIGATTAVFSVVYGLLLRPLPCIRLAIGASPSDVVRLFVREGLVLTLVGLTVGLTGALAAGQWIRALLFGVTPADPTTFAAVGCGLTVAAVCASYVPARRTASVDPTSALRTD